MTIQNETFIKSNINLLISALFLIFVAVTFILDNSKYKTVFYLILPIPAIFILNGTLNYNKIKLQTLFLLTLTLSYFSLSTLWSAQPNLTYHSKNSLLIALLFIVTIAYCKTINYQNTVKILFYFTSILAVTYLMCLLYQHNFKISTAVRLNLAMIFSISEDNPISSGIILGAIILIAFEMIENASKKEAALAILTILSAGVLLLLTKSRGPLLSTIVSIVILVSLKRDKKTLALTLFFVTVAALALLTTDLYTMISNRLEQPNYRLSIWKETLSMMESNWFFGHGLGGDAGISVGAGSLSGFTHSHSFLMEAFRIGGGVGLLIFTAFILTTAYYSSERKSNWLFLVWLIFGMLCLMSNGRFPLMRPSIEWFCFWIPLFLWFGYSTVNIKNAKTSTTPPKQ